MARTPIEPIDLPKATGHPVDDDVAPGAPGDRLLKWVTLTDVQSLLAGAGHAIQPLEDPAQGFMAQAGGVSYSAALVSPRPQQPGRFGGIQLSAFAPVPESLSLAVAARLALDLPGARLGIDRDGDLALMQTIVVEGGATRANVGVQFDFWLQNLERVRQAVVRHFTAGPQVVLH
jgi:hypothetical protein